MAKNLVIVESPAKAKTIGKFLGKDYRVESSYGHIADLPKGELGVDIEDDFTPIYIVGKDKQNVVEKLRGLASKADTIWLASDEDREGEAISWHLAETLQLDRSKTRRIVFNSITKSAIQNAMDNPRDIDYNLVNAQQARRVLDRLVGYQLSPVLWKKVRPGLSAGRVQSVAVRLIVEREREITAFQTESSFRVKAVFRTEEGVKFEATLAKAFPSEAVAAEFVRKNIGAGFQVEELEKKPARKKPAAPFTTSTLQQEASRKLGYTVSRTMNLAQRLYEAGLITYMRTDSVNLSPEAIAQAKEAITGQYGERYSHPRNFTSKTKGAQEAHEAIRPTRIGAGVPKIESDQARLYDLIQKRTLASQMSEAELERTTVKISSNAYEERFGAKGEVITFDGFLKVYLESRDDEDRSEEEEGMLPKMNVDEPLGLVDLTATERFSRPPYRYSEASLVKKLEELGIGRPSTYAPTVEKIIERKYVAKGTIEGTERNYMQLRLKDGEVKRNSLVERVGSDKGKLVPTDIGMVVNDFLVTHFSNIVDYHFTARVEEEFDEIATGEEDWKKMMGAFYKEFQPVLENVEENAERASGERVLGVDPKSGREVLTRLGKYGPIAQIGRQDDEEDPAFASLLPGQSIANITLEEALMLFELPRKLGVYEGEEVEANIGRYGPYVRFGSKFISLGKGEGVFEVDMDRAVELIEEKKAQDRPVAQYEGHDVTKGVGRFGPFLKWNGLFINVNKKYDFDNLSQGEIEELIEAKKQKEIEKVVAHWPEEDIRIEKARWGRHVIIQGKTKVELNKEVAAAELSLDEAKAMLAEKAPKKTTKTNAKKGPKKKAPAKKSTKKAGTKTSGPKKTK